MVFLLGGAVLAAPAAAADPAQKNDDSKVICRRVAAVGTRLAARVCHTRAEWRQIEDENRDGSRERVDRTMRENRADPWPGPTPK